MFNPREYNIGDNVLVRAIVDTTLAGEEGGEHNVGEGPIRKVIERTNIDIPKVGKIIGITRINSGILEYDRVQNRARLVSRDVISVWHVRFGMYNKPVKVSPEDLSIVPEEEVASQFPLLSSKVWTEEEKRVEDVRRITRLREGGPNAVGLLEDYEDLIA